VRRPPRRVQGFIRRGFSLRHAMTDAKQNFDIIMRVQNLTRGEFKRAGADVERFANPHFSPKK